MLINKPCSNSLLHSQPNATQPTTLRQQCSHQLHNSLSLILPRSIQQEGEEADVEDMGVAARKLCEHRRSHRANPIHNFFRTRWTRRPAPHWWRWRTRWWCVTFRTTSHAMQCSTNVFEYSQVHPNDQGKNERWHRCLS